MVAAGRAWRDCASHGDIDVRRVAERRLADELERWTSFLLSTHDEWALVDGAWSDGLIEVECRADESDQFTVAGWIWAVGPCGFEARAAAGRGVRVGSGQPRYPFRATFQLRADCIAAFDVRVADAQPGNVRERALRQALLNSAVPWRFRFVRGKQE